MEIVLPGDMTVAESHDIALALQHKARGSGCGWGCMPQQADAAACALQQSEELEEVERAFVHVDYQQRDAPEHKVERELLLADSASSANPVASSSLQQRGRASRVAPNGDAVRVAPGRDA